MEQIKWFYDFVCWILENLKYFMIQRTLKFVKMIKMSNFMVLNLLIVIENQAGQIASTSFLSTMPSASSSLRFYIW